MSAEARSPHPSLSYKLCPRCARVLPTTSAERHCINDGVLMLEACPSCRAPITHPYARHCSACGASLVLEASDQRLP